MTWTGITEADTGGVANIPRYPDMTVQVTGTFGGMTVGIEGSNDGTNYSTLNDAQGNALSLTAAGIEQILENTEFVRIATTGGTSASVNVIIHGHGDR